MGIFNQGTIFPIGTGVSVDKPTLNQIQQAQAQALNMQPGKFYPVTTTYGGGGGGGTGSYQSIPTHSEYIKARIAEAFEDLHSNIRGNNMLEPIHVPGTKNFRVPLLYDPDVLPESNQYALFVGNGYKRYYGRDTLPDIVKSKLAIINTSASATRVAEEISEDTARIQIEMYISKFPKEFEDVGWRVSNKFYCIVMPQLSLIPLQSGMIDDA